MYFWETLFVQLPNHRADSETLIAFVFQIGSESHSAQSILTLLQHSQHREPLLGLPLCPHRDRSGSQELAVLKTVAIAGAWQFEDRF